jgi:transcriptional regulator with XRE-family HTH domain
MGLYQKDLAKILDIHPSQVTARMRGKVAFTLDDIETLAEVFGIEPAALMPPRPVGVTQSDGRPDEVRSAETPDEVRRQGLEPRTRWLRAIPGTPDLDLNPLFPSYPERSPATPHHPDHGLPLRGPCRPSRRRGLTSPFHPVIVRFATDGAA